jgi:hypothetical protein
VLIQELFNSIYENVASGLFTEHQTLLALRLVQIRLSRDENFNKMFNVLLKPSSTIKTDLPENFLGNRLNRSQLVQLEWLDSLPEYNNLVSSI